MPAPPTTWQEFRVSHPTRRLGGGFRAVAALLQAIPDGVYARLAIGQPICPADLIFVLAGLPERKRYGWELFQQGLAPVLLLSVGRSEARFLKARAGVPEDGGVVRLLPIRPEQGNHIFLWVEQGRVRPEVVRLPERNTFGEVSAFCAALHRRAIHHALVLSTDVHLRRIRYAVGTLLGPSPVRITYLGVPEGVSTCRRHRWWGRRQDARLVMAEWVKLAGYRVKYGVCGWHRRHGDARQSPPGIAGRGRVNPWSVGHRLRYRPDKGEKIRGSS
jgi:hypothetical protein